jgi:hypothetical protein
MTNLKGLLKKQFVKERSGAVATCKQIVEGKVHKYKFQIYHLTRTAICTLHNNSNISYTHHQSTRSFSRENVSGVLLIATKPLLHP